MTTTIQADEGQPRGTESAPSVPATAPASEPRLVNQPDTTRTIRAGVVMNGGISFAVWMGGATEELDRARLSGVSTSEGTCASKAWWQILNPADTDLVVDVIAGTSAGGLNGAALATAIANGVRLPHAVRDLWLRGASLKAEALLRPPDSGHGSVLSGDYFLEALHGMLESVARKGKKQPGREKDEVTLFITTARLDAGELHSATRPDGKVLLGAPNHLNRPHFRHRHRLELQGGSFVPNSDSDFTADAAGTGEQKREELANAGRASAGFPFAFQPLLWDKHQHLDGGLLDNTPFRPVMEEITQCPRSDSGERWLVYVTPGGGRKPVDVGSGWSGLVPPLLALLRETDLASDDEALSQATDDSLQGSVLPEEILRPAHPDDQDNPWPNDFKLETSELASIANSLLKAYQLCRAREYEAKYNEPAKDTLASFPIGFPTTLEACRNHNGVDTWQWGVSAAQRMARRISREARSTGRVMSREDRSDIAEQERRLAAIADHQSALIEPIGPFTLVNRPKVRAALDESYAYVCEPMSKIVEIWSTARGLDESDAWQRVLATEVLSQSMVWTSRERFPKFDLHQITPRVPDHADQLWVDKLYAGRLGGFGAFLAEDFRKHDWCWGRLDAATTLAEAILGGPNTPAKQLAIAHLQQEICDEEGINYAEFLRVSEAVAKLDVKQVIALARDQQQVDLKPLRNAFAQYLVNDEQVPRRLRPAVSFLLTRVFQVFMWSLPSARTLDPTLRST